MVSTSAGSKPFAVFSVISARVYTSTAHQICDSSTTHWPISRWAGPLVTKTQMNTHFPLPAFRR